MGDSKESPLRRTRLIEQFPGLARGHFRFTSPIDHSYNCFAYAAGETWRCWDPQPVGPLYWPKGAPQTPTLPAFIAAYATRGYTPTSDSRVERGVEKIAIYVAPDGTVSHVARQLATGLWTSKMGPKEDIEHELEGLEGDRWGAVALVLARDMDEQVEMPL